MSQGFGSDRGEGGEAGGVRLAAPSADAAEGTSRSKAPAPSRVGRKQIIAYCDPTTVADVHALRESEGKTVQEILGEAINASFLRHGLTPPIIELGHRRVVRRTKQKLSKARTDAPTIAKEGTKGGYVYPSCRQGLRPLAGWFDQHVYDAVVALSARVGESIQDIVRLGISRILQHRRG